MGKGFFRRVGVAIIGWLLGNIAWIVAIFIGAKLMDNTEMLVVTGLLGFLLLILVGVVGTGWYFLRERQSPAAMTALENMARWVTLMYFAQKYNVSPDALGDLDTPQAVEERARRLQAEKQLAELNPP